jgi:hypothetical protein
MRRILSTVGSIFSAYLAVGFAYGLWVFVVLGFSESCNFTTCSELPHYHSRILNIALALLPDQTPYAVLIGVDRGIAWLPNLLLSLYGTYGLTFMDWLLVRDVLPMRDFYAVLDSILL